MFSLSVHTWLPGSTCVQPLCSHLVTSEHLCSASRFSLGYLGALVFGLAVLTWLRGRKFHGEMDFSIAVCNFVVRNNTKGNGKSLVSPAIKI